MCTCLPHRRGALRLDGCALAALRLCGCRIKVNASEHEINAPRTGVSVGGRHMDGWVDQDGVNQLRHAHVLREGGAGRSAAGLIERPAPIGQCTSMRTHQPNLQLHGSANKWANQWPPPVTVMQAAAALPAAPCACMHRTGSSGPSLPDPPAAIPHPACRSGPAGKKT